MPFYDGADDSKIDAHAGADLLNGQDLCQLHFGGQGYAVAGVQGSRIQGLQESRSLCHPAVGTGQVEAAQNTRDARLAADRLGVGDDVADAAVGAAGDDEKPIRSFAGQGGVIRQQVGLLLTVQQNAA